MSRTKKIDKQETSPEIAEKETECSCVYKEQSFFYIPVVYTDLCIIYTFL